MGISDFFSHLYRSHTLFIGIRYGGGATSWDRDEFIEISTKAADSRGGLGSGSIWLAQSPRWDEIESSRLCCAYQRKMARAFKKRVKPRPLHIGDLVLRVIRGLIRDPKGTFREERFCYGRSVSANCREEEGVFWRGVSKGEKGVFGEGFLVGDIWEGYCFNLRGTRGRGREQWTSSSANFTGQGYFQVCFLSISIFFSCYSFSSVHCWVLFSYLCVGIIWLLLLISEHPLDLLWLYIHLLFMGFSWEK